MNKEKKIQKLKEQGKTKTEISKLLEIPYSTVCYHYDEEYKKRHIEKAKERNKKHGYKRNEDKYREYQRNYHNKRYKTDKKYREKVKKLSREYQRRKYRNE